MSGEGGGGWSRSRRGGGGLAILLRRCGLGRLALKSVSDAWASVPTGDSSRIRLQGTHGGRQTLQGSPRLVPTTRKPRQA